MLRALKRKERIAEKEELEAFKVSCKLLQGKKKKEEKMARKMEASIANAQEKVRLKQQELAEL